jgi:MEKHLA domain
MARWILQLLVTSSLLWTATNGFLCAKPLVPRTAWSLQTIPPGRVEDIDEWMRWTSDSLNRAYNQSLLELMAVDSIDQIHTHKRYAVLSHGIQDDPIFCYSNVAARDAFQYTEDEFYQLPSRYSAPGGGDRQNRQKIMEDANNANLWIIPSGIRQRKDGSLFEFRDVILWNVYNPQGVRVGQSAVYDQFKVDDFVEMQGQR